MYWTVTKVIICYSMKVITFCLSFLSLTIPVNFWRILFHQNPVPPGMRWPANTTVLWLELVEAFIRQNRKSIGPLPIWVPPPLSSEGLPYDEGSLLHLIRPDVPFMRGHLWPCLASPGRATETIRSTSVVGRNTHPVLLLIYPQVFKKGVNRHTRSYADVSLYGQIKVDR